MSASESAANPPKRKNLTTSQKRGMIDELFKGSTNGVLIHGDLGRVADMNGQHRHTVSKYWKESKKQKDAGVEDPDLHNKRRGNSGKKGIDLAPLLEALKEIPLKNRTTQRSIAAFLGIAQSTLFNNLKKLGLRSCSRFLKPLLTDDGKARRLEWALRWVRNAPGGARKFQNFFDFVHLDEKWFYICKQGQRYFLYEGEDLPIRKVQHKSHVTKVIFLAAVARPRFNPSRNRQFDGKIGIYPFTEHSVEVNRATYKETLINNVFPDIRAKFPTVSNVFAQQDNAPGHRVMADPDIVAAAGQGERRIEVVNQPPNSPETNILDLGFFNSIQSLQDRTTPTMVDELVAEVERAFWAQKPETLDRVWTTLQSVLQEIMLARGGNTFKLPHLHKRTAARRNEGIPPELPCSQEAWQASQAAPA